MWLTRDERRLLAGYYRLINEVGREHLYHEAELRYLLRLTPCRIRIYEYGDVRPEETTVTTLPAWKKFLNERFAGEHRVQRANDLLLRRGLIELTRNRPEYGIAAIALTLPGYDLGNKYANFLTRSGLWFSEYRNHWLLIAFGVFVGVLATKCFDVLWDRWW